MKNSTKKVVYLGLCIALSMVLSYLELLIPPIYSAVPGIKMGLPNIVILYVLYKSGWKEAFFVSVIRVFAVSLLFGNAMTLAYSIAGAILSLAVMLILKRTEGYSCIGVSVAGAVSHNLGQILVAMCVLGNTLIGYYMLVLAITGTLAGILVGIAGAILIKRL